MTPRAKCERFHPGEDFEWFERFCTSGTDSALRLPPSAEGYDDWEIMEYVFAK
jgi:hypothetical protein